jgi:hypothetical protein
VKHGSEEMASVSMDTLPRDGMITAQTVVVEQKPRRQIPFHTSGSSSHEQIFQLKPLLVSVNAAAPSSSSSHASAQQWSSLSSLPSPSLSSFPPLLPSSFEFFEYAAEAKLPAYGVVGEENEFRVYVKEEERER